MRLEKPKLQNFMMITTPTMAPSPQQPLNRRGVRRISGLNDRAPEDREGGEFRVCTANIGTMIGRSREVVEMLARRKVDVCSVQEVQYKGAGCRMFGCGEEKYKLWWSGEKQKRGGVGVLVREDLVEDVIEVIRISARIMKIKMVIGNKVWHIFSVYAPQVGRAEEEKEAFWRVLDDEAAAVAASEVLLVAGDLNGHIGDDCEGFEEIMGIYGFGERNRDGERILEFCQGRELMVLNTMFKKDREKKITYKSGGAETQIDFLLMRKERRITFKDCKVIPGEACLTQHRLLSTSLIVRNLKRKKNAKGEKKIKAWKLKEEETRQQFEDKVKQKRDETGGGWEQLSRNVMEAAKEVCGETTGHRRMKRETWWWNEVVQQAIQEKKLAFRRWQQTRTEEDKRDYKEKSKLTKREVSRSKRMAWERWSSDLSNREQQNEMFKIAKQMKKERKDVLGAKYVKDDRGEIKVQEKEILERWATYFGELLNEENQHNIEETEGIEGPIEDITKEEVERALGEMKMGKAPGPTGVTSDLLKRAGIKEELTTVFRSILEGGNIPESWKNSLTIPIYKGKGDALECGKYRGVRLLEHGMKIFEKVLEKKLRKIISLDWRQCGFCTGRSTTDAIFVMRQIQEKYCQKKKKVYHVFVDLEKAFDRVPRRVIEWALRRQGVPERLVEAVMALYVGTSSRVKTVVGTSEQFDIDVGVHQGSALSPLLFITVMEEATKHTRGQGPWELLYADDLVLTAESKEEVVEMFNRWKAGMEERGLRVNMDKTKMMVTGRDSREVIQSGAWPCGCCGRGVGVNSVLCTVCDKWCHQRCSGLRILRGVRDFVCPRCTRGRGELEEEGEDEVVVDGGVIQEVQQFCYLGDVLDCEAGVERAVRARVAAAWRSWREIASLLVNSTIDLRTRGKVYEACVRPVLMYGSETWALTDRLLGVLRSCDRRMLRYMARVRWQDGRSSEEVAEMCGVDDLAVKIRQGRLRWFGHVRRAEEGSVLHQVEVVEVQGRRPVGRPRKAWSGCVRDDMETLGIGEGLAQDRDQWRRRIIARPTPP
jgi:hypothetical protein